MGSIALFELVVHIVWFAPCRFTNGPYNEKRLGEVRGVKSHFDEGSSAGTCAPSLGCPRMVLIKAPWSLRPWQRGLE